jgi:predicted  nucleic acid-binding Zn-ribbon protein
LTKDDSELQVGSEYNARGDTQFNAVDTLAERNNPEQTNGVGGIPAPPANDALLVEIGHLQRDVAILRQEKDGIKAMYDKLNTNLEELTRDLDNKTLEMRKARKASEDKEAEWECLANAEKALQQDIEELRSNLQDQKTKLQSVKRERDRLKPFEKNFHDLESNFDITFAELEQRNTQLLEAQKQYKDIQTKHAAASDELNRMKNESRSMLDDAYFTTKWIDLQADVKQWAESYFWVERENKSMIQFPHKYPNINTDLLMLSNDCNDLLTSEGGSGRPIVAEAYLWRYIEDEVLDGNPASHSKGFLWAHTLRSEFCRMEEFLRPGELRYHSLTSTRQI